MLAILLAIACTFCIVWCGLGIAHSSEFRFGREHRIVFVAILLLISGFASLLAGYLLGGSSPSLYLYAVGGAAFSLMVAIPSMM